MATSLLLASVTSAAAQVGAVNYYGAQTAGNPPAAPARYIVTSGVAPAATMRKPVATPNVPVSKVVPASGVSPADNGDRTARTPRQESSPAPTASATIQPAPSPAGHRPTAGIRQAKFLKEEVDPPAFTLPPKSLTPPTPTEDSRPNPSRVFRMDSNETLDSRMVDELYALAQARYNEDMAKKPDVPKKKPTRDEFILPEGPSLASTAGRYVPKTLGYAPTQLSLEPGYVVYRRLFFEDVNAERYGWDLGLLSPVVSSAYFYKDVMLFPAHLGTNARERYETSAGKCLPGTPVPYFLYPPEISLSGAVFGAAAITGVALLLP